MKPPLGTSILENTTQAEKFLIIIHLTVNSCKYENEKKYIFYNRT